MSGDRDGQTYQVVAKQSETRSCSLPERPQGTAVPRCRDTPAGESCGRGRVEQGACAWCRQHSPCPESSGKGRSTAEQRDVAALVRYQRAAFVAAVAVLVSDNSAVMCDCDRVTGALPGVSRALKGRKLEFVPSSFQSEMSHKHTVLFRSTL